MVKGAQKQMIVLKTSDSRYFDEAYFVLRREVKAHRSTRNDMLTEANRILEESALEPRTRKKRLPRALLLFLAGILCGGGLALLLCLVII